MIRGRPSPADPLTLRVGGHIDIGREELMRQDRLSLSDERGSVRVGRGDANLAIAINEDVAPERLNG